MAPFLGRVSNGHSSSEEDHQPTEDDGPMPIAIIGMACRLPGEVSNLESFWEFCQKGPKRVGTISGGQIQSAKIHHANPEKPGCVSKKVP